MTEGIVVVDASWINMFKSSVHHASSMVDGA